MPQGINVWAGDGSVVMDTSTRLGTVLGQVHTGKSDGFVVNAALGLGTPFWCCLSAESGSNYPLYQPIVTVVFEASQWRLKWTWITSGANYNYPCNIIYGVY